MKRGILTLIAAATLIGCTAELPTVEWVEGARDPKTKLYEHELIVRGVPEDAEDWVICSSMHPAVTSLHIQNSSGGKFRLLYLH